MTAGQSIDALRRLGCHPEVDGNDLRLVAPSGALGDSMLAWLREHKIALLAKLAELPPFTDADERALIEQYASQPRAVRLTIHRRGEAIAKGNDWPAREADLSAMREYLEAAR